MDVAFLIAVGCAILYAHREALAGMVRVWTVSPMYSYGFTIPLISAYLLWTRREALSSLVPRPAWIAGSAAAFLTVVMSVAARVGGFQLLDQVAFVCSLTAAVLLLLGSAYLRVAWPALAYLFLMIPMWDGLTEPLHEGFQLRSATIGVWLLQAIGIPTFREGTMISLPGIDLEVARACSGVNYLVAVVALGIPLTYLNLTGVWRRVVLLAIAVVVAALSNGLRVALIGMLAHWEIGSPLHGPFHMLHGLFVAGIGYVVLFAGLKLLAPAPSIDAELTDKQTRRATQELAQQGRPGGISLPVTLALIAVFVVVGSNVLSTGSQAVTLAEDLGAFPPRLGEWTSVATSAATSAADVSLPAKTWPGADTELRRQFQRSDGTVVDLYVGYFAKQEQRREIGNYRAGDLQRRSAPISVPAADGRTLTVNHVRAQSPAVDAWFWFRLDNGRESDVYTVKVRTLLNAVSRGRNPGLVIVLTTTPSTATEGALRELAPLVDHALEKVLSGAGLREQGLNE